MNGNAMPVIVIGGGVAGLIAANDIAEVGIPVILVEKEAYLGGRVMGMYRYFPKMCPPGCGFEINMQRLRRNPRITVHTLATVEKISGEPGDLKVSIRIKPRYVTHSQEMDAPLSSERVNEFNYGMDKTKALYLPHDMAFPPYYVLDREALIKTDVEILTRQGVDLSKAEETLEVTARAVIVATGWRPYDANKLDHLGFNKYANVITNMMLERLAARNDRITRPSDNAPVKNTAFIQCAGSRDELHLPYCSAVCCMASLKQARYLRAKNKDCRITIFYIDIRAVGRHESFYTQLLEDDAVSFVKGKAAQITQAPHSQDLLVDVEDTLSRKKLCQRFDLAVLATGMRPNPMEVKWPQDQYGFYQDSKGVYAVGCAHKPCDVSSAAKAAAAAAIKAIRHG